MSATSLMTKIVKTPSAMRHAPSVCVSGRVSGITPKGFWIGHGAPKWSSDRDKFIPRSQILRTLLTVRNPPSSPFNKGGKRGILYREERSEAIERLELLEVAKIEIGEEVTFEIPTWLREKLNAES